jgi:hypothetical protein
MKVMDGNKNSIVGLDFFNAMVLSEPFYYFD